MLEDTGQKADLDIDGEGTLGCATSGLDPESGYLSRFLFDDG